MSDQRLAGARPGDAAAVVGVVVAGVLASFVIPGPYSWDTMMLGALMLIILVGFAGVPVTRREAAGVAAALAFALLFLLGRLVDDTLHLSHWPEWGHGVADDGKPTNVRQNLDRPDESFGWETLLFWLGLFVVSLAGLRLLVTDRGTRLRMRLEDWPRRRSWLRWPTPLPDRESADTRAQAHRP